MDPGALLHPVGPHEPRVYWTRRAVLFVVVLVLVLVLAFACGGGSSGTPTTSVNHPRPTPSTSTSAPASPAPTTTCTAAQIRVTATTDAASYPAGVQPHLTVAVRNTSAQPCRLPVGPGAVTWTIVSGPDQVWTTAGCPHTKTSTRTLLRRGQPWRSTIVWDRHRSVPGCATQGRVATAGTYQLRTSTLGVAAPAAVFHLTG
jgi:hypothetical protein